MQEFRRQDNSLGRSPGHSVADQNDHRQQGRPEQNQHEALSGAGRDMRTGRCHQLWIAQIRLYINQKLTKSGFGSRPADRADLVL
jgi:hypothetical protein